MNGDTFTIIDESGKKDIARIVTAFSYKEKDYIVYSIFKDANESNIYVSRLVKDSDGSDMILDIDDEEEKKEVTGAVEEILSLVE